MPENRADGSTPGMKIPAIIILIVLIVVAFLFLRSCDKPVNEDIKTISGSDQASLDQAAAEKAAAKKAAEEKAAAEAAKKAAEEKAATEAAKKAAELKAAAEAEKKAAAEKAAAEKAAAEKAAAEAAAKKAAEEKAAAEAAARAAASNAADDLPHAGFTYSAERAAEIAEMQKSNMAAIMKVEVEAAAKKAADEKAAAEAVEKAAAAKAADDLPHAGFTYSDERATEMQTALANLRDEKPEISMADKSKAMVNAFGQAIGEFFGFKLPNGQELMIPKGGIEESMLNALGAEAGAAGNSYILDRIFFTSGSSALDKQSTDQIESIAAILKAYPNMKLLLRGHTDNTGTDEVNKQLSSSRADAVMNALAGMGIDASRMSSKGIGAAEPVESNETAEGRRMNRRIDITVM